MKRVNLLPNVITAFSLSCGLFIIFRIMLFTGIPTYSLFKTSTILLLVAAVADVCDGAMARILKAESEFGVQFDSLADSITFGVAPSVITIMSFQVAPNSWMFFLLLASSIMYSLCGVLRLARYNTKAILKKTVPKIDFDSKSFTGLPIPAAALAVISLNLFLLSDEIPSVGEISVKLRAILMICAMVIAGFFMVSRWKFPSLKTFHFRVKSFSLVFLTAVSAVALLYGIFNYFSLMLLAIFWGYMVIAWTLSIIRLIAGRKSKTLSEFEIDDE